MPKKVGEGTVHCLYSMVSENLLSIYAKPHIASSVTDADILALRGVNTKVV